MQKPYITIAEIQQTLGVGRILAERYARESGAVLPRVKNGEYKVRRKEREDNMEQYNTREPLEVMRKVSMKTDHVCIGDQIVVDKYTATCQKIEEDGAIFCMDQYLDAPMCMNAKNTNRGGYEASDLRKRLNSDELSFIFKEIAKRLVPFPNGDYIRIPYCGEIFGRDDIDRSFFEADVCDQWPLMKKTSNRVAYRKNEWEYGWLQNVSVRSAANFALVDAGGVAYTYGASYAYGVRPVFKISLS